MKFSILVPAYKPQFLAECIESILAQTYPDWELIIVNDASPYDIDSIVSKYDDERIHYRKREQGFGAKRLVENWDGGFKDVIMKQDYSHEDDVAHMKYLCENVFMDRRYIKVDGKPFFVIYRPSLFPNIQESIETWRTVAAEYGMELYLGFMRGVDMTPEELLDAGFDVSVEFQPHFAFSHLYAMRGRWDWFKFRLQKKYLRWMDIDPLMESVVWDYSDYVKVQCERPAVKYKQFPGITPQWDNAARRIGKMFWCLYNSTLQLYGQWLRHILKTFEPYSEEENFIFINAWNEWAEGNHLEPDQRWGRGYLEETKNALKYYL